MRRPQYGIKLGRLGLVGSVFMDPFRETLITLFRKLDYTPQGFWSWDRHATGGFYQIRRQDLDTAMTFRGVSVCRKTDDLKPCIKW